MKSNRSLNFFREVTISYIKENDRLNVQVHKALPPQGTYQHSHKMSINQTRFDN